MTLNNKGTIDANRATTLTINPTGTVTNTGTLEATAGGTLNLPGTVNQHRRHHPLDAAPARR